MEYEVNPVVQFLTDQELLYSLTQMVSVHYMELTNVVNVIRQRAVLDPMVTMDFIEAIEEYQRKLNEIFNRQADILENPVDDDPIL